MKKSPIRHQGVHVGTFISGAGFSVHPAAAQFSELKRLAEAGDARAQNDLGVFYTYGINGAPRDLAAALKWYAKAVAQNLPSAIGNLGYVYQQGLGCPKDEQKGLALIRQAVEAGDIHAMNHLAYAHMYGLGTERDEIKAAAIYRQAATSGDAHAMAVLADFLRNGRGCVRNDEEAIEWARKGAGLSDAAAMFILGDMYRDGRGGVARDLTTAAGWYDSAARLGERGAQEQMGRILEQGDGLPKNMDSAVKWYELAAGNGCTGAIRRLAELRFYGIGVPKHMLKAVEGFRKAAEAGDVSAMVMLGNLAATGCGSIALDPAMAATWLRKAAEAGHAMAQFLLGEAYENGDGVDEDSVIASEWFHRAADQGNKGAERALLTPRLPLLLDLKQFTLQVRESLLRARNADPACMVWVAGQYFTGNSGFPRSHEEALRWCELAHERHDSNAVFLLAAFYLDGICVPRNPHTAIELLRPLADTGNVRAQKVLSAIYGQPGAPGESPAFESLNWLLRAVEIDPSAETMNSLGNAYFSLARSGGTRRSGTSTPLVILRGVLRPLTGNRIRIPLLPKESQYYREALTWYRKAADKHCAQSFTNIADFSFGGFAGVPQDDTEAFRLYSQASKLGDPHADVNLGIMLMEGWGCGKDEKRGRIVLEKAQAAGSVAARAALVLCYSRSPAEEMSSFSEMIHLVQNAKKEFVFLPLERRLPAKFGSDVRGIIPLILFALVVIGIIGAGIMTISRWILRLFA